jgi:hypothetical protein
MHSHADYKANPFLATKAISALLRSGGLNLFLGSGVSAGFGLPQWAMLVARILGREAEIDEFKKKTDKEMAKLLNEVDDEAKRVEYLAAVHHAIYEKVEPLLLDQLARSPLLLAVGALMTGSCRGRIQCVFTYNFDDLLEQYLGMLGLGVCVRSDPTHLSTRADVEINHVHGFLPQAWTRANATGDLVLSGKAYRKRRSAIDSGWSQIVESSMYSKCALLLGLSADDDSMLDIFKRAHDRLVRPEDYHGYWLLTPDAYERNAKEVLEVGLCPVPLDKTAIPKFVFEACQRALVT